MKTNEIVLHNSPKEYCILMTAAFSSASEENNVNKTAVAVSRLRRIQYAVSHDMTVDLTLDDGTLLCQLSGQGSFVLDSSAYAGSVKIDRAVHDGFLYVSTHGAKSGAGYTVIVTGAK